MERGFEHPCFEDGFGNFEEVLDCLERTEDEHDCTHLFSGEHWESCKSGKLSPYLPSYRRWQQKTPYCWTTEKPKRAGYYWYIGPVLAKHFQQTKSEGRVKPKNTWGPIVAQVGLELFEARPEVFARGNVAVTFHGSTVRRTLADLPSDCRWCGPIVPPISDWAWHLQPAERHEQPATCEINASEIDAFSVDDETATKEPA